MSILNQWHFLTIISVSVHLLHIHLHLIWIFATPGKSVWLFHAKANNFISLKIKIEVLFCYGLYELVNFIFFNYYFPNIKIDTVRIQRHWSFTICRFACFSLFIWDFKPQPTAPGLFLHTLHGDRLRVQHLWDEAWNPENSSSSKLALRQWQEVED